MDETGFSQSVRTSCTQTEHRDIRSTKVAEIRYRSPSRKARKLAVSAIRGNPPHLPLHHGSQPSLSCYAIQKIV